jgi:hypothetical protein
MNNKNKGKILWLTRTSLYIAPSIVSQAATAPLGNTLITGSIVNMMLIVSVITCGLASGLSVAVCSQIFATLLGIGPQMPPLIPFIIAGNVTIILIWHFVCKMKFRNEHIARVVALAIGAVGKFLVLYFGVTKIAAPLILNLPPAAPVYVMFSFPQLITASIGGALATAIIPTLKKVIGERQE